MTTRHAQRQNGCKQYILGFISSIILIFVIYALVQGHMLSIPGLYIAVGIFSVVVALIMVFCFLLLNTSDEDRAWNAIAFIFTIMVMVILVVGSLWIMYSLNYNMVP